MDERRGGEPGADAELLLDEQQLVVLDDELGDRGRADLICLTQR